MFTYQQAMGGMVMAVLIGGTVVVFFGPENTGVSFRKSSHI
jgi:hypothetical protein